jgi:excisionase family DNA binding protein
MQQSKVRKRRTRTTDLVSFEEAQQRLRIGRNQLYAALAAGKVPALRLKRKWRIPRIAFERMLAGEPTALQGRGAAP